MATALAHTRRAHGGNAGSTLETPPLQGAVQGAPWFLILDGEPSFPARGRTEQRGPAPRGVPPASDFRLRSPLSPKGSRRSRSGKTRGEESSYVTHLSVWGSTCSPTGTRPGQMCTPAPSAVATRPRRPHLGALGTLSTALLRVSLFLELKVFRTPERIVYFFRLLLKNQLHGFLRLPPATGLTKSVTHTWVYMHKRMRIATLRVCVLICVIFFYVFYSCVLIKNPIYPFCKCF